MLVQSPARHRLVQAVSAAGRFASCSGRRGEGGAPFAHDLPRRHRRRNVRHGGDVPPYSRGEFLPRNFEQVVGGADRHREASGKREQPLRQPVHYPDQRGEPRGRLDTVMRVDDRPELRRRRQARDEFARGLRGNREDDAIVRRQGDRRIAEVEFGRPMGIETEPAQPATKGHAAAARLDVAKRGIHEGGGEPVARDQRMIAAPARRERLADHARREHCGTFWRVDVERGREEGFDQALIERSRARNRFLDRRAAPRPQQPREREIFGKARAGRAALSVENPPGDRPVVGLHGPTLACLQIDEGERSRR